MYVLQTKCLAELQVTFIIFVHLPCIHFLHCVQHTALDPTLFPCIPQGSILLKTIVTKEKLDKHLKFEIKIDNHVIISKKNALNI